MYVLCTRNMLCFTMLSKIPTCILFELCLIDASFCPDDESSSVTSGRTSIETTLDEVRATLCADNKNFALLGVNGK